MNFSFNYPTGVLTRSNSTIWTELDFVLYEQELKQQMKSMNADVMTSVNRNNKSGEDQKSTNKVSKQTYNKQRRNSTISLTNCTEWSNQQMKLYEKELLNGVKHLTQQLQS
eukprot:793320_1